MKYSKQLTASAIGLTPEMILHNQMLDLEIELARKHNEFVDQHNRREIARWNKYREDHPEDPWRGVPNLIMDSPRIVMGIRYVE